MVPAVPDRLCRDQRSIRRTVRHAQSVLFRATLTMCGTFIAEADFRSTSEGSYSSLKERVGVVPEGAGRCQAGFRPAVSRWRGCLQGMLNWPGGSAFLRAGAVFVRAGGPGPGPGGARPAGGRRAGGAGAGGALARGPGEPMIEACGERLPRSGSFVYAVVVTPRP